MVDQSLIILPTYREGSKAMLPTLANLKFRCKRYSGALIAQWCAEYRVYREYTWAVLTYSRVLCLTFAVLAVSKPWKCCVYIFSTRSIKLRKCQAQPGTRRVLHLEIAYCGLALPSPVSAILKHKKKTRKRKVAFLDYLQQHIPNSTSYQLFLFLNYTKYGQVPPVTTSQHTLVPVLAGIVASTYTPGVVYTMYCCFYYCY